VAGSTGQASPNDPGRLTAEGMNQLKRSPALIAYVTWVGVLAVFGTALLTTIGAYWDETETLLLQMLWWGLAPLVWFLSSLLGYALTGITLGAGGGTLQYVLATFIVCAGVASAQFLILRGIVTGARAVFTKLVRADGSRKRALTPEEEAPSQVTRPAARDGFA
jgi:hypothetical protein